MRVSLKWVLTEVSAQLVLGVILALLLDVKFKGRGIYRCIVFFPWAVSGVLPSMLWSLIYNEDVDALPDGGPNYAGFKEKMFATKDGRIAVVRLDGRRRYHLR